jgi:GMP synthase (glutamine-hydrolysing)
MARHEVECLQRRVGAGARLSCHNIFASPPDVSCLDGRHAVIIGGSGAYSVHDPRSSAWVNGLRRLLDVILAEQLPTFGICFGHQLLAFHLGSPVNTDVTHAELGTTAISLSDAGLVDPLFSSMPPTFHVHTGHSDHVAETPPELERLAFNKALSTQAFRVKGAPVYTTQFHPDLNGAEAMERYLAYHRSLRPIDEDAPPTSSALFRAGLDESTTLLGRFFELFVPT